MAEQQTVEETQEDEMTPGYKPPAEKSVQDLLETDKEDESLRKYKESLGLTGSVVVFENDPRHVIVQKVALLVAGRDDVELDLTGNMEEIKKHPFVLKEGCQYKIKVYFYVQREIAAGIKYVHKISRKSLQVDKDTYMMGSFAPRKEMHTFTTPLDEAPSGLLARGSYHIKSYFMDDDKKEHAKFEWQLEIKKDWK